MKAREVMLDFGSCKLQTVMSINLFRLRKLAFSVCTKLNGGAPAPCQT
jgi:hypothetical protein